MFTRYSEGLDSRMMDVYERNLMEMEIQSINFDFSDRSSDYTAR